MAPYRNGFVAFCLKLNLYYLKQEIYLKNIYLYTTVMAIITIFNSYDQRHIRVCGGGGGGGKANTGAPMELKLRPWHLA